VPVELESSSDPIIHCDEIEVEQVIIILINNGIDAVKNTPSRWLKLILTEEDQTVVLRCLDSGSGINREVASKLFQPFFTTKAVGQGTGLGLSIAKGILQDHGASIELIENHPHTCFEIRFPKPKGEANANIS
jgi:C4-dicarboxylate-specific signal transduction histidine kinase